VTFSEDSEFIGSWFSDEWFYHTSLIPFWKRAPTINCLCA